MADPAYATDPDLIARLEAAQAASTQSTPDAPAYATDPGLIARLEAAQEASANPSSEGHKGIDWSISGEDVKRTLGDLGHLAGQVVQAPANAAMGLANTIANPLTYLWNKATSSDVPLPSEAWEKAKNTAYGGALAPRSGVDRLIEALGPLVATAGASGPNAEASLLNPLPSYTPSSYTKEFGAGAQVPANFVAPDQLANQAKAQLVEAGQAEGLKVPPATSNPTTFNRGVELVGGKTMTAQESAVNNAPVYTRMAQEDLGIDTRTPLTQAALNAKMGEAGAGFRAARKLPGPIAKDDTFLNEVSDIAGKYGAVGKDFPGTKGSPILDEIDSLVANPTFSASSAIDKITQLRDSGTVAFRAGDKGLGSDYKTLATSLENQIDRALPSIPGADPATIASYRDARVLAAKVHDVQDAFDPATGQVSARALNNTNTGQLTGKLKLAADWAANFEKTAQSPAKLGSVGVNKLAGMLARMTGAGLGAAGGAVFGHPIMGAAGGAATLGELAPMAEELARKYALGPGQAGAVPSFGTMGPAMGSMTRPTLSSAAAYAQMLRGFNPENPAVAQALHLQNP